MPSKRNLIVWCLSVISMVLFITVTPSYAPHVQSSGYQLRSDFNGDGFDDLAIGIPGKTIDGVREAGGVAIISGGPQGLFHNNTHQFWHRNDPGIPGDATEAERWGSVLETGDFNNDGFHDLVIASPFGDLNRGVVVLLYGSKQGLTTQDVQLFSPNVGEQHLFYGASVSAGDFNGDGFDDLAVGVLNAFGGQGAVQIFPGSSDQMGFPSVLRRSSLPLTLGPAQAEGFGSALASGDFNNDGIADLAIGAPRYDRQDEPNANAGRVYIVFGTSTGLDPDASQAFNQDSSLVVGQAEAGDAFAALLVAADFDGNDSSDLGIGIPGEGHEGGQPPVLRGGAVAALYGITGISTQGNQLWHQNVQDFTGVVEDDDLFGAQLAVGDFDGDDYDDLVVGVPLEDFDGHDDAGVAHVIYGSQQRLTVSREQLLHHNLSGISGLLNGIDEDELFGGGLGVGDFDGDGFHDLAIGIPQKDFLGMNDVGAVIALYGSRRGITTARSQVWMQEDVVGFNLTSDTSDNFGLAISGGSGDCSIFATCAP